MNKEYRRCTNCVKFPFCNNTPKENTQSSYCENWEGRKIILWKKIT